MGFISTYGSQSFLTSETNQEIGSVRYEPIMLSSSSLIRYRKYGKRSINKKGSESHGEPIP